MSLWAKKVVKSMRLYVIYDRAAEECSPIMQAQNDAVALRGYRQALQNCDPVDRDSFWFYCVGSLDLTTMEIDPCKPERIEMPEPQIDLFREEEKKNA